jgi:hypothetical protein
MMTHFDCKNYIHLDCEKGMCTLTKAYVPVDGEGSQACPKFVQAQKCGNCANLPILTNTHRHLQRHGERKLGLRNLRCIRLRRLSGRLREIIRGSSL